MKEHQEVCRWIKAAKTEDFPTNGGACVKIEDMQIAVFNFSRRSEWFACQNLCPHKLEMVLARGMLGEADGEPKVACPFHKKSFSLCSGENMEEEDYSITVYPV